MLLSMTGYGRAEFTLHDYDAVIEIRSLNGKQLEVSSKIPPILKLYEIELRNIIQQKLFRGSIDVSIFLKQHGLSKPVTVNIELAKYYYSAIEEISKALSLEKKDILPTLMRMPDIVSPSSETVTEHDWKIIQTHLETACDILNKHREQEGKMLAKQIIQNIEHIRTTCEKVEPFEKNRIQRLREKLNNTLQDFLQSANADKNRLEQEIIYYIEKFDITEEKSRLTHHCDYFIQLLNEEADTKGKKLGFLLQEIGREINTMGSKANDAEIQKLVVDMKDDLEQAKEQLLNAL